MSEIRWNEEQQQAISLRHKNILVAAAAGSGKTAVLVERIRRLVVEEDVSPRELLVLTFTNAAAAEMKDKIRRALTEEAKRLQQSDPRKAAGLRAKLKELPTADISTFHSFALKIIRRFFYLTDLEPGFTVCDETRALLLREEALDLLLESEFAASENVTDITNGANSENGTAAANDGPVERAAASGNGFLTFMDHFASDRNPQKVRDLLTDCYDKLMAMPHPWKWLDEQLEILQAGKEAFAEQKLWAAMQKEICKDLEAALKAIRRAEDVLWEAGLDRHAQKLQETEERTLREALKLVIAPDVADVAALLAQLDLLLAAAPPRLAANKAEKGAFGQVKDRVKLCRDEAHACLKNLREDFLALPLAEQIQDMRETGADLATLTRLLKDLHALYHEAKQEARVVDFSDIEHYCLAVLEHGDGEAARGYRERFSHIFIDEYQDTNILQDAIISHLKRDDDLFMVGDVKQSIYRFRLADPTIFQKKYKDYADDRDPLSQVIDLNSNYRSKDSLVRGINRIFRDLMPDYDERAELHTGDPYRGPLLYEPQLTVLATGMTGTAGAMSTAGENTAGTEKGAANGTASGPATGASGGAEAAADPADDDEDGVAIEDLKATELEALHVAEIIKDTLGMPIWDTKKGAERPVTARDIVVLLRSVKSNAESYARILKQSGIDSFVEESDGYFDTMEIGVFMDLLAVIDNRRQDIPLISVLHAEIFGFSAAELAAIRARYPKRSFAEAFLACAGQGAGNTGQTAGQNGQPAEQDAPDPLAAKCRQALATLDAWRQMARVMPLPAFL
ncbi:MAG: UvrD-helicase domain-containing protein, partial [Firmicutes bacterium]|nr:UvrD-helicase domain-containing protein [Bacillota bacterium]